VYQQNVFCWGRTVTFTHIPDPEIVFCRIHAKDFFSKISFSRSDFDFRCESDVFTEPVLEWNLIFVLQSKILGSFQVKTFICSKKFHESRLSRECGTYTFNSFSLAL